MVNKQSCSRGGTHSKLDTLQLASLFASAWVLSGSDRKVISSHGVLDRALYELKRQGKLPQEIDASISFATTAVGLRCLELRVILNDAQHLRLATFPNPSYEITEFTLGPQTAYTLLEQLKIDKTTAKKFGEALREALQALADGN